MENHILELRHDRERALFFFYWTTRDKLEFTDLSRVMLIKVKGRYLANAKKSQVFIGHKGGPVIYKLT